MTAALMITALAHGAGEKWDVGGEKAAPGIDVEQWIHGNETSIEKDHSYVVLIFKTRDPDLLRIIRLMTELQEKYADRGFHVIGVMDEELDVGERYVRTNAEFIGFPIAIDRRSSTKRAWSRVAGSRFKDESPMAYVVGRRGKVQVIGQPLAEDFTRHFPSIVAGRFEGTMYRQTKKIRESLDEARKMRNYRMCFKGIQDVLDVDPHVFAYLTHEKFEILLVDMNERDAAYEYAAEILKQYQSDGPLLADLAILIATDPKIPTDRRDMDVAMELAEAAAKVFGSFDPRRYTVPAQIHFARGEIDDAIRLQRRAYLKARPHRKAEMKRVLDDYRAAKTREAKVAE